MTAGTVVWLRVSIDTHCDHLHNVTCNIMRLQAPCADQLARLQALLGLAQLPGRTFLSFLLLVGLAPHSGGAVGDGGDGGSAARPADAKRRRVATDAAADAAYAGAPQLWGRAAVLLDSALSS